MDAAAMSNITKYTRVLGIIAVVVLIASGALFACNVSLKAEVETDFFTVNGKEYGWNTTFEEFEIVTLEDAQGNPWEGVMLADLITDAGVADPENHEYKLVGADGYTKTVGWSDMETGLLTKNEKRVFFPDLPKAYYVSDLVEIEVI